MDFRAAACTWFCRPDTRVGWPRPAPPVHGRLQPALASLIPDDTQPTLLRFLEYRHIAESGGLQCCAMLLRREQLRAEHSHHEQVRCTEALAPIALGHDHDPSSGPEH